MGQSGGRDVERESATEVGGGSPGVSKSGLPAPAEQMGRSGVSPTDAEMITLGEELCEAARSYVDILTALNVDVAPDDRARLAVAVKTWDEAMTDRFMAAIKEIRGRTPLRGRTET